MTVEPNLDAGTANLDRGRIEPGVLALLAINAVLVVTMLSVGIFPVLVDGLVRLGHLNGQDAGLCVTAEMIGQAVGAAGVLVAQRWIGGRHLCGAALALILFGNGLTTGVIGDLSVLLAARFVAGLGCGLGTAVCIGLFATTKHPDRNFAINNGAAIIACAALAAAAPFIYRFFGISGIFAVIGGVAGLCLILVPFIPVSADKATARERASALSNVARGPVAMTCIMSAGYFISLSMFWSYAGEIAAWHHLDVAEVSAAVASAWLIGGLLGSMVAIPTARRLSRRTCAVAFAAASALTTYASVIVGSPGYVSVVLYSFVFLWFLLYPIQMGIFSDADPSGRLAMVAYLVQLIAFAIGPAWGGMILRSGSYKTFGLCSSLGYLVFISAALIFLPANSKRAQYASARSRTVSLYCIFPALIAAALLGVPAASQAAAPAAVESADGMVVTAQHLASDVGAAILRQGGNAVDAAVAVGYALAVTHPCCGNLGGGGFMTIHLADGRNTFINFREKAPLAARADMFLDARGKPVPDESLNGYLAAGVPGTVLGLETAHHEYGTLPRSVLMAPSIRLAEEGFLLTRGDVDDLDAGAAVFREQPNVAAIFLHRGVPFKPGERLVQKNLAATLRAISDGGAPAFYRGAIADAVAAASRAHGGLLTREDFSAYEITESAPIVCRYRGYTILSAPPPSSGGVVVCEVLQVLEGYPLKALGFSSSDSVHLMTEALRYAYRDRNTYLGDPAFVENPIERLLSTRYAEAIRARIQPRRATPSSMLGKEPAPDEKSTTTHYSVADAKGNAVSVTYTINDGFGAKVIAGDTGFFLNDEMDDFTAKPGTANKFGLVQGEANSIAPGKRPLSSMSPTIVLRDGKPVLIVGSPGGSRIITTVLQIILNVIDHEMTLQEAVDSPRMHHQWLPDTIAGEPFAFSADTVKSLTQMGYRVMPLELLGSANAAEVIGIAPEDAAQAKALGFPRPGLFYGANDSRAPAGSAAAP